MMRPFLLVAPGAAPMAASLGRSSSAAPPVTALRNPAPNPTGNGGILRFSLASSGQVSIHLFDAAGRLVRTIASGWYEAGDHEVTWRRADQRGGLANGVYFVKLETGGVTRSQKVMVLQ